MGLRHWPRVLTANTSTSDIVATTTESTGASTSSSATGGSIDLDLNDAELGNYTNPTTVDGDPAIQMTAPANGEASFTIDVNPTSEISTGELAKIIASIRVGGENTRTHLQMFVNASSVYDKDLDSTKGRFQQVTSDSFKSSEDLRIRMIQQNGDDRVELTLKDAMIVAVDGGSTRTSSAGSGKTTSGSSSDSGSDSKTETGTGSTESTGSPSETSTSNMGRYDCMANKGAVYIISLITAFLF
ncbi:hypothetical protein EDB81DRAFT_752454 [Dactylonectria macrodidyma]|uniref:Uncharacterized protein n=1 Tax=Dactylonectria macrodidyma TaxID=307937 RepID=A0A9P9FM81_9HYPO|nr:hypothetical protein EDB81DRAFT_752454 [Dactylonectria macrodidyma]